MDSIEYTNKTILSTPIEKHRNWIGETSQRSKCCIDKKFSKNNKKKKQNAEGQRRTKQTTRTNKMSAFTETALIKKLMELNASQQSIQTLSLWLIHHRKHYANIVKSWYKELMKGNTNQNVIKCRLIVNSKQWFTVSLLSRRDFIYFVVHNHNLKLHSPASSMLSHECNVVIDAAAVSCWFVVVLIKEKTFKKIIKWIYFCLPTPF